MAATATTHWQRELDLLSSLPAQSLNGFVERAQEEIFQHPLQGARDIGIGVGLGLAVSAVTSRIPEFKALATLAFGMTAAGDLASRFAGPMRQVWNNANSLEEAKKQLGQNVGSFAFDYGAVGLAGLGTSRLLGPRLPYPLDALKKPIPLRSEGAGTALNYHTMPIDTTMPLSPEPLVRADKVGLSSESYYARTDGTNIPYNRLIPGSLNEVWLRQSVAERLTQVNKLLAPRGLELHILDAYRPVETQQALWDHFIEMGRKELKTNDPAALKEYAGTFASDPSGFNPEDPLTWPTHNTGGAVDLTLKSKKTGQILDMGGYFDESSPRSFTDALERTPKENAQALINRRILHNAMSRAGFANYPYEWWHYDHGTQMWLQNSSLYQNGAKAWYGPATLPKTGG